MAGETETRYTAMIRELRRSERPRERLRQAEPSVLSNAELIAILLRRGTGGESLLTTSINVLSLFGAASPAWDVAPTAITAR